tara:strand:- start:739 stop:1512 length:774 start_codon:yes stop_codon:yes gene_type:complete
LESTLIRKKIRNNQLHQPTCGFAKGFVQTNLVVLPIQYADDFEQFCHLNSKSCPIIERLDKGSYEAKISAPGSDIRVDLISYRKFNNGVFSETLSDLLAYWKNDLISFLIGCSFSFEAALKENGIYMPHYEKKGNVAMYSTNIETVPSAFFSGPLVVSMRWIPEDMVSKVIEITSMFPKNHGGPIHIGDPKKIGIKNLEKPDFGQYWKMNNSNEVPVFWACGVTPQLAINAAKIPLVFTHSPGYMFITDLKDEYIKI